MDRCSIMMLSGSDFSVSCVRLDSNPLKEWKSSWGSAWMYRFYQHPAPTYYRLAR